MAEDQMQPAFAILPGGNYAGSLFPNLESFPGQVFYTPTLKSKSDEVRIARREIVRQARQVERASEPIRGGIDRMTDMVAGAKLTVHPTPDWDMLGITDKEVQKELVKAFRREFNNWAYDSRLLCDAEGHYNFGGLMWMAFRNLAGPDAESAIVIHYDEARAEKYGARWATYITVVDPDRIETPSDRSDDKRIFEGRVMDPDGRMIGMFVRKSHPSETTDYSSTDYTLVPRETNFGRPIALHWFIKTRGMQQRGISPLATVIKQNTMLRNFDDSYLGAAVINSQLATYIKTKSSPGVAAENLAPAPNAITDASAAWGFFANKVDYYGRAKFKVGGSNGSRLPVLPPDDEIVMSAVNRAIDDPTMFRNGFLREFASALGLSFEQLSLNYSDANYSSARAALLEVWRGVIRIRTMFTTHVSTPIYGCIIEEAIGKGRIKLPAGAPPFQENRTAYIAAAWTGPGMAWIDPLKEATAYEKLINMRITNRGRVAAERGDDFFEILAETGDEYDAAEEIDVELDPIMPGQVDPNAAEDPNAPDDGGTTPAAKPKPKPKPAPAPAGE